MLSFVSGFALPAAETGFAVLRLGVSLLLLWHGVTLSFACMNNCLRAMKFR
jgi:hypothetical protein